MPSAQGAETRWVRDMGAPAGGQTSVFAPPVSWLREWVAASKHPSRLPLVPRGAPGWAPTRGMHALDAFGCGLMAGCCARKAGDNDLHRHPLSDSPVIMKMLICTSG